MESKLLDQLLAMLPDGEKKNRLIQKYQRLKNKASKNGRLHDQFELKPKGHIMIEEIDQEGNVVGVLADQPNLVVDGAEEILLRAFSGDPKRTLYKIRVPKTDSTPVYYIEADQIMDVLGGQNVLTLAPNEFWKVVDDKDFDIEFSFYPNTVYVEEVVSNEPNKKAFRILKTPNASTAPLSAEIYSAYTNLFIGIGDGKNYDVPLNDPRLTFSPGFSGDANRKESETIGDSLSFNEKITNFVLEFERSNTGGQIEVLIDNVSKQIIDTYDETLADGETKVDRVEFNGLDPQNESQVNIRFAGNNAAVTTPKIAITGLKFDALSKDMNHLIHEMENFTTVFDTPSYYNTTTVPPYTVQLEHFPVLKEKVVVLYEGVPLTQVNDMNELDEGKFYVDALHGTLYFHRALTGLMITYEITGELYDNELVTQMTLRTDVPSLIQNETPTGAMDGNNKVFVLSNKPIISDSVVVKLDGVVLDPSNYSVNASTGTLTFTSAPISGSTLTVDYKVPKSAYVLVLPYSIKDQEISVFGQDGVAFNLNSDTVADGTFRLDENDPSHKTVLIAPKLANGEVLTNIEFTYRSDEMPGVQTNYARQIILKPKDDNDVWYSLDKGSVEFVAEFNEDTPNKNMTIREMGLFDGPRAEDHIRGYDGYPVHAFSLVRVPESRKDTNTGIRITWTITLLNEDGQPFHGGLN